MSHNSEFNKFVIVSMSDYTLCTLCILSNEYTSVLKTGLPGLMPGHLWLYCVRGGEEAGEVGLRAELPPVSGTIPNLPENIYTPVGPGYATLLNKQPGVDGCQLMSKVNCKNWTEYGQDGRCVYTQTQTYGRCVYTQTQTYGSSLLSTLLQVENPLLRVLENPANSPL